MKLIPVFIVAMILSGCTKPHCKHITVEVVNGCANPVTYTKIIDNKEYCGSDLDQVRKLARYDDYPNPYGYGTCRVSTIVIEQ
jgi:hypothetical protein